MLYQEFTTNSVEEPCSVSPDKIYYVYKHTSPTGKVYIGITRRQPSLRWQNGLGYKNNIHFFNAIMKYGWDNFKHEILYSNLTKEEAEQLEIQLIAEYDSTNPNKGYNIAHGGLGSDGFLGHHHTEEAKQKISEHSKKQWENPEYRAIMRQVVENHPMKGVPRPDLAERNRQRTKPVICVETKVIYPSIREAERQTGIKHSDISAVCKGYRGAKTAGGYHWKYI